MRAATRACASSAGAAVLSLLVCVLCSVGLAYPLVFLAIGVAAIGAAVRRGNGRGRDGGVPRRPGALPLPVVVGRAFGMYFVLYLANAMAPEVSPDGAAIIWGW